LTLRNSLIIEADASRSIDGRDNWHAMSGTLENPHKRRSK
jgi:hypothetical protein